MEIFYSSGTSEATAIVSGCIGLFASCNPSVNAPEMMRALLDYSEKQSGLKFAVQEGRILTLQIQVCICVLLKRID